ncbi:unnamed protein product [Arabidopsis halleri]
MAKDKVCVFLSLLRQIKNVFHIYKILAMYRNCKLLGTPFIHFI